ncbi:hypothetical protein [Agromyces aureus]|uniref:Cell division protein FtsL n=1 Tax=Agromyces aureus TaxID=453304 RepID=A0A191WG87_9MICO|nr:hypothetical protein [Agromyces aureus]ANJ27266.1 hypothetical protein ATC03_11580 [Agromyces aureus]
MSALPAQSALAPAQIRRRAWIPEILRPAPDRAARSKPRLAYAVIAVSGVVAIAIAQLMLSIAVTQGAYEIDGYELSQAKLSRQQQTLSEDLDRVQSPQYLAKNAEALGMVPNTNPVFLRLSDGAVLGQPTAASGGAAASAALVPNVLIGGVPLVTEQPSGQTAPVGGQGAGLGGAAADPAVPAAPAPPPVSGSLPTPTTH